MLAEAVQSGAELTSSSNVQTVSDFWMFVVYCLVVIVVVLFFLFYFNRALGQILTWLINQYTWRRYNAYIEEHEYCLKTYDTTPPINPYLSSKAMFPFNTDASKSRLPCRIVCSVEGLEWFLYNNAAAYDSMRNVLGVPSANSNSPSNNDNNDQASDPPSNHPTTSDPPTVTTTTTKSEVRDPESQIPVEASLLLRLMPVQFECTTGAIMIGNNELRSMIVGQAVQASGIWSVSESRAEMDHYKSVLDLVLRKTTISLKDNMDFTYAQPESDQPPQKPRPLWRRTMNFFLYPFQALFHPAAKTRQFGHMQHMHGIMRAQRDSDRTTGRSTTFHEDYARVNNVLECSKLAVLYYADVPGPVPSTDVLGSSGVGIDVGNGGLPPEWGVRILVWNAMLHYGPWTDRQRTEIQDYFFPNSHRNNVPTPYLKPGELRMTTAFEFHVELMTEGTLRVPTREKSKDWKYETESADLDLGADGYYTRPYGWIDAKAAAGSTVKVVIPFVCGSDGFTSTADIHLKDIDASTSVNYASLLQAKHLELSVHMHSPIVWNTHREWEFNGSVREPQVFLLRDHVFLFQDLIKDWTSTPPADLLHFIPVTYNFTVNIHEPLIYLCVNEHNIISNPNALDDNAYIKLHTSKLCYTMTLPFVDFEPEINVIKFHADLEQFDVGISLQSSHTLSAFMEKENAQFGMSVSVAIEGSYEYYTSVDVLRHIESLNLNIKLNGVTCKLFGTVIRYIIILKDNYAGQWINFSTIDEYRQRRQEPQKYQEMKKRQADAKAIQDPFEVYVLVDIQDGSLLLPENLYDCSHYSQMDIQELQVELRNLDIYMDMYITVSPITWTRESYTDPSSKKAFVRSRNGRDQGNFLYIDELSIYAHRLFGPLPEIATYLCHWDFEVGRITGEVKPSFLLGTTNFAQTFAYDLIDEDNAVPAEIAPAADPDVTFLKASVKEVDVYLMNDHSAAKVSIDQGLSLEFDNLVNEKYNQRVNVNIPALVATTLANQDNHIQGLGAVESEFSWVEVAKLTTGMNITVFRHSKEWRKMRNAQQNFIRAQDYATRRCTHLYDADHESNAASHTSNEYHVGVLYAPPYRSFHYEEHDTGFDGEPNPGYLMRTPSQQPENYAIRSFKGAGGASDVPSVGSYVSDWIDGPSYLDKRSRQSVKSNDDESFHTAYSNDPASRSTPPTGQELEVMELYDHYSSDSREVSDTDDDSSHNEEWGEEHHKGKAPEVMTIPPSIPYSGYLNRYAVKAASPPGTRTRGFFHPYLPPPKTHFVPLKEGHRKKIGGFDTDAENKRKDNPVFLFPGTDTLSNISSTSSESAIHDGDGNTGNEVVVTAILEATSPLQILMTPILVKIVQEVSEAVNRYDWDLESMLDALQIEYVGQLTRYLTDQFVCTRFAVSLPKTHFHFIQNVMLPDDLPSYKDGKSHIKTQYDEQDATMLCSADVILDSFSMIGSVKFEDEAYDEKQKSVAESKMILRESRVHIDVGDLECKVQYVSERHETAHEPMVFGIPRARQHTRSSSQNDISHQDDNATTELVVVDFVVRKFAFKWLGATKPNYFDLTIDGISTIIITEAVEILVGAVYSWLVFVDDFKAILQRFQNQRSRQIQMFIHELSGFSQHPSTVGDPLFLTKPATVLRLGSRNFRNDVGWKLLARMRYCLRTIDAGTRARLQYRLSQSMDSTQLSSKQMFENVVKSLSLWRSWEIGEANILKCRLFTQPFNMPTINIDRSEQQLSDIDKLVELLISSVNMGKIRIEMFEFCIFEEEQETDDNSIAIGPVELAVDTEYKRPPISNEEPVSRASGEVERRHARVPRDGYLDVIAKASVDSIRINTNPAILAFARHMLTVQRVFTARLRSLSHATTISTDPSATAATTSDSTPVTFDALMSRVDVVAQALVTVQYIDVCARAQKLTMQSQVREIQGSALFSNPKLTPLHIFSSSERAESDSGSGVRSSNKTSRRHNSGSNRLILEAAGGIEYIDARFYEMKTYKSIDELLVITLNGANVSANISQPTRATRKQSRNSIEPTVSSSNREVLNVFSNIHKFNIHAPQSLLRLYEFIEDWRSEQGQRYEFLFQNLLNEWEEQRKVATAASHLRVDPSSGSRRLDNDRTAVNSSKAVSVEKKYDLKLQFLLNQFEVLFDLLPSLSVKYLIDDFFVMVDEIQVKAQPVQKYAVQLSKQEIQLIAKSSSPAGQPQKQIHDEYSGGTFSIPGIRSTGSLRSETNKSGGTQLRLHFMVFVDFISLSLNVSMIDSFLTAQSLLGNEIGELIEVLSYDKKKRKKKDDIPSTSSASSSAATTVVKYSMDVNLSGLRISAASPSALGVFESNGLEAHLSNDTSESDRVLWKVKGYNFALSLEHNTGLPPSSASSIGSAGKSGNQQNHRNRLAYIVTDFEVQNHFPQDSATHDSGIQPFYVDICRIQTVMQPIALGKLAEMYIYYDSELKKKKEMKKTELDQIAQTTKRLVQSFKRDVPKYQEATHSLWEGKLLSLSVQRLGVAIPLEVTSPSNHQHPHHYYPPKETSALLLSVASIHFLTKDIEKSAATLEKISLQFVKRFDQNNEEHFLAERHPRMNQMHLPSIACHVYTRSEKPKEFIKIDAKVGGFEVDIDGAFSEYVNALNVIYVKSKDRVNAFTKASGVSNNHNSSSSSSSSNSNSNDSNDNSTSGSGSNNELVHLDLEGMFEYQSGVVRMYPKRHSGETNRKRMRATKSVTSNENAAKMATIKVPGLTAWFTYQTPLGPLASVVHEAPRFHGDIRIHESDNTLHPSLVQFLQEVIAGLKFGMQQSSERKAIRSSTATTETASTTAATSSALESNINASLALRLSRTKLDLSCQPASKVVCSISWEESEFLMHSLSNEKSASRTMSCVGYINNLSATVKHFFSPEACLTARIDQLLMNAMLTSERSQGVSDGDVISIIVKLPSANVDVNVRHLQDLLILNAFWFEQGKSSKETPQQQQYHHHHHQQQQPQQHQETAAAEAPAPKPFSRYVSIHTGVIQLSVDLGQAIGKVTLAPENLGITTHHVPSNSKALSMSLDRIRITSEGRLSGDARFDRLMLQLAYYDIKAPRENRAPSLLLFMDGFSATFEYEFQHLLDIIQEPIEFRAQLVAKKGAYELDMTARAKPLLACVSIKAVPVIITMYKRFTELLEKKKIEAGVLDTLHGVQQKQEQQEQQSSPEQFPTNRQPRPSSSLAHISSNVDVRLDSVEVVIYPSQFQDADNVELCAYDLHLVLLQNMEFMDNSQQEEEHRTLAIRLAGAALMKNVPGVKLMVKRNAAKEKERQAAAEASAHASSSSSSAAADAGSASNINGDSNDNSRSLASAAPATTTATTTTPAKQAAESGGGGVSIFGIPNVSLQMESNQLERQVEHIFSASFGGRVNVSLNLGLIRYLQELANMFTTQMERALQHDSTGRRPSGAPTEDARSFDSGVAVNQPQAPLPTPSTAVEEGGLCYKSSAPVNFHPQLQIMGDATPPVEWLGFKRDRLPALVHENITLVLDRLVHTLYEMYEKQ
ncbi:hypothetical protein BDB00DRAFT_872979 [Zychaea mexicana]|uniref:uncharacterized protein n=1 Tax=Zychaea mexicana TaxID=64656 RepID=UPI0022FF18E1|nr:uncharacterized protein BDB00DRAFT_872979 [Zychaea mexicana]KAI9492938.1 hypothetical protein BDB00DRAFT_872979 [Zychaea mexicana]